MFKIIGAGKNMAENRRSGNTKIPPNKKKPRLKIAVIVFGLFLALFILKVVLILTALPTISVDYAVEFNRISKPISYDPNKDAAFDYKRAFDRLVEMPEVIKSYRRTLASDLNDVDLDTLKKWFALNSVSLDHLEKAAAKPYYWFELSTGSYQIALIYEEYLDWFENKQLCKFYMASNFLNCYIRFESNQGRIDKALEHIITLYRIGSHLSGPKTLTEQLCGISLKNWAVDNVFTILGRQEVNAEMLRFFEQKLKPEICGNTINLDFQCEKLIVYDIIQRVFTDNGKGSGKLIPGQVFRWIKPMVITGFSPSEREWIRSEQHRYAHLIWIALTGPSRRKTVEVVDKYFTYVDTLKHQTPWQLHNKGIDSDEQISKMVKGYLIEDVIHAIYPGIKMYQKLKVNETALFTTLAVLRYKADNERYPESLEQLVTSGYLEKLPMDPYSDGSLVYKRIGDDFTLYSLGVDFDDDGGVRSRWGEDRRGGDQVFWPVEKSKDTK